MPIAAVSGGLSDRQWQLDDQCQMRARPKTFFLGIVSLLLWAAAAARVSSNYTQQSVRSSSSIVDTIYAMPGAVHLIVVQFPHHGAINFNYSPAALSVQSTTTTVLCGCP